MKSVRITAALLIITAILSSISFFGIKSYAAEIPKEGKKVELSKVKEYLSTSEGYNILVEELTEDLNSASTAAYIPDTLYVDEPRYTLVWDIFPQLVIYEDCMYSPVYSEYGLYGIISYRFNTYNEEVYLNFFTVPNAVKELSDNYCSILDIESFSPEAGGYAVTDTDMEIMLTSETVMLQWWGNSVYTQDIPSYGFTYSDLNSYSNINVHKGSNYILEIKTSSFETNKIQDGEKYYIVDEYGQYLTYSNGKYSLSEKNNSSAQKFELKENDGKFAIIPIDRKRKQLTEKDFSYLISSTYYGKSSVQILTHTSSVKALTSNKKPVLSEYKYSSNQNWYIIKAE